MCSFSASSNVSVFSTLGGLKTFEKPRMFLKTANCQPPLGLGAVETIYFLPSTIFLTFVDIPFPWYVYSRRIVCVLLASIGLRAKLTETQITLLSISE